MKKFQMRLISILALLTILSACSPVIGPDYEQLLANTEWVLTAYGDENSPIPALGSTTVTLQFKPNGLVGGTGGCNVFSTQAEVSDGRMSFWDVEATAMACQDEGIMAQESAYFTALNTATRYVRTGDELRIWYKDGKSVLIFNRVQAP